MNTNRRTKNEERRTSRFFAWLSLSALLLIPSALHAYPPAPHHLIYGTVRDELGNPITFEGAEVILQSLTETVHKTEIVGGLDAGVNYQIKVPMDAGLTSELYAPTALRPTVGFRMYVKVGSKVYLPIEMNADYRQLGQAGQQTRIDLTLGEDNDGDGIPDAWERALLKPGQTIADINPGDDTDGDGMSNLNEYLAGNYAFDDANGFELAVVGFDEGEPIVEFTGITGRTYTVLGSANLKEWQVVQFSTEGESDRYSAYYANDIRLVRMVLAAGQSGLKYFILKAQ